MKKVCTKCKNVFPLESFRPYWDKRKGRSLYYRATCRGCERKEAAIWKKKNPEAAAEQRRRWRNLHPMAFREYSKAWKARNPKRAAIISRRCSKNWAKKNPEKRRLYGNRSYHKRRMQIRNTPSHEIITAEEQLELLKKAKAYGKCPLCKKIPKQWSLDHAIPLSRGGNHSKSNVYYCCFKCNSTKRSHTLEEFWGQSISSIPYLN